MRERYKKFFLFLIRIGANIIINVAIRNGIIFGKPNINSVNISSLAIDKKPMHKATVIKNNTYKKFLQIS